MEDIYTETEAHSQQGELIRPTFIFLNKERIYTNEELRCVIVLISLKRRKNTFPLRALKMKCITLNKEHCQRRVVKRGMVMKVLFCQELC
jgi:regulatory protein YycH of two-component signal transduction system YycFG